MRNSHSHRLWIARDALRVAEATDPISLAAIWLRSVVERLELEAEENAK